jgi:hypothetical protein
MMRIALHATLSAAAAVALLSSTTHATVLTFSGHSSNEDLQPNLTYGSNLTVADDSAEFITTGPSGATPDVALLWGPSTPNVLEFHNASTWVPPLVTPGVMQLDVDISSQTELPADPTIDFTVPAGVSVILNSLIIGNANDQRVDGNEPPHAWTINLIRLTDDATVFTHTTAVLGTPTQAGASEIVNINYTGDPGVGYRLHFDDGGADTPRGAIDNLDFSQVRIPEPASLVLLALCGALVAGNRRHR